MEHQQQYTAKHIQYLISSKEIYSYLEPNLTNEIKTKYL
jgi:hypothetical protein